MKRLTLLLFTLFLFIQTVGCTSDSSTEDLTISGREMTAVEGLKLELQDGSPVDPATEVNLLVVNDTSEPYIYGDPIYLEMHLNETWYEMPVEEHAGWHMEASFLGPGEEVQDSIVLGDYYGALNSGRYRVIKMLYHEDRPQDDLFVYAEFDIK